MRNILGACLNIPPENVVSWQFQQSIENEIKTEIDFSNTYVVVNSKPWEPGYSVKINGKHYETFVSLEELFTKLYDKL